MAHLVMVLKFMIMSAMNRPMIPNTPPLAPTTAMHVLSNAALNRLPAATPLLSGSCCALGAAWSVGTQGARQASPWQLPSACFLE